MFCSPMLFSIPQAVSQIRGGGLPCEGLTDKPLTTTAPSLLKSKNPAYSNP
ncbi:hypothetical protein MBAV_002247 [Candidatus Magnetobacterium bavaricum]|uniref:Uncharacterized protein n=1 Tax=Candidatus Magnetobacterium bavaricum TaxID=29290 RepID=A0A0F3GXX5_9BACT|nr:hypothetical protein MBAV_002247 [Candidatus Magnetobacterium bavaricum]